LAKVLGGNKLSSTEEEEEEEEKIRLPKKLDAQEGNNNFLQGYT
jgi:hypothetical protein